MIKILYSAEPDCQAEYFILVPELLAKNGIECDIATQLDPADVDYIIYAPSSGLQDFTPFSKLKAVLSLWAGVERIENNASLRAPLCRMVDDGLRAGMREWVLGHIMRHHLGLDNHIQQQDGVWRHVSPPLARQRSVGILGIGELGQACAEPLAALGFNLMGWSRSQKDVENVACYSGDAGLETVLSKADFLVLLLPQTAATRHIINAESLAKMKHGAVILNPGRGPLIDDNALLAALDSGQIAHATLDVFETEPLPPSHAFWHHANVTVTPHIASDTRSDTAAQVVANNIIQSESGQELLYQVDRKAGY